MLVLPDADLDLVADSAVNAGFGSAGERCMAISVVLAVDTVADTLVEKISERMATLKTGDGTSRLRHGPADHPRAPRQGGGVRRHRGHRRRDAWSSTAAAHEVDGEADGFWLGPDADRQRADHVDGLHRRDLRPGAVGGPGLRLRRGPRLINSGHYGNGTAIFTNDGGAARRFQREVEVGMVGVNVPIPVPVAYHSFGGWKASLFGDAKAYGPHGVDFFTREKAVTAALARPEPRWPEPGVPAAHLEPRHAARQLDASDQASGS